MENEEAIITKIKKKANDVISTINQKCERKVLNKIIG
jgi:hypothetical protein